MTPSLSDCDQEIRVPSDFIHRQEDYQLKKVIMVIQGPKGIMRLFEYSTHNLDRTGNDQVDAIRRFMEWNNG